MYPLVLLFAFASDAFRLGRATVRSLVTSARKARRWLSDYQVIKSDFRCISCMFQKSLDKTINVLILNFLESILTLPGLNSSVIADCFDIFNSCFFTSDNTVMITCGSEQLAETSAMCFFRAFSSLLIVEPTLVTIEGVRQWYKRAFPSRVSLQHLTYPIKAFRYFSSGRWRRPYIAWTCYSPSFDELVPFALSLAQVAQFKYHRGEYENRKVPRWLIRFALRFPSQYLVPPTSVVIDCLTIVATDLGCNVSAANSVASNEKCVRTSKTAVSPLTLRQHTV